MEGEQRGSHLLATILGAVDRSFVGSCATAPHQHGARGDGRAHGHFAVRDSRCRIRATEISRDVNNTIDLPLSTAVFLGARFPYVTPEGAVPVRAGPCSGLPISVCGRRLLRRQRRAHAHGSVDRARRARTPSRSRCIRSFCESASPIAPNGHRSEGSQVHGRMGRRASLATTHIAQRARRLRSGRDPAPAYDERATEEAAQSDRSRGRRAASGQCAVGARMASSRG